MSAATGSPFSLILKYGSATPIGLTVQRQSKGALVGAAVVDGTYTGAEADDTTYVQDVPAVQPDWSAGAFISRRVADNGYGWGEWFWGRDPRVALPAGAYTTMAVPAGASEITDTFELDGHLFLLAGRYALRAAGGVGEPQTVNDFGAGMTADGVGVFNGAAFVGIDGGPMWSYQSGTGTWQASGTGVQRRKAAVVSWLIPDENLGRVVSRLAMTTADLKHIKYTGGSPLLETEWTPGTASSQPDGIPVGESTYPITSLVSGVNHFWIGKQDGLWDLNARGDVVHLTPTWRQMALGPRNAAAAFYDAGWVYLSHENGAIRVNVATDQRQYEVVWITPGRDLPNETPVVGPITAWAHDGHSLLAAVYNANLDTSYIGSGRERARVGIDGPGPILWHFAEAVIPGRVTHMRVSSPLGQPRLWIAATVNGTPTWGWQSLPKGGSAMSDLRQGGNHAFAPTYTIYGTAQDWDDPDAVKVLRTVGVRSEGLGSGTTIAVAASAEGGPWVSQGTVTSSPRQRLTPRAPLTRGYEPALRITGTGGPRTPAILRAVKQDAELTVDQTAQRSVPVVLAAGMLLEGGTQEVRKPSQVFADLVATIQRGEPVVLRKWNGDVITARIHPIAGPWKEIEDGDDWRYEFVLGFTELDVIATSTVQAVRYGSGVRWGSGSIYGGGTAA